MNDILYSVKFEFKYLLKSKYILVPLACFLFVFIFLYNNSQSLETEVERYNYTVVKLKESGFDI